MLAETMKMPQSNSFVQLFRRERRCGDLVFAVLFLLLSVWLLSQLSGQTQWVKNGKLFAQPSFWPALSLIGMTAFAVLHFLGSVLSPRIHGRMREVAFWLRSVEYALWFLAYVWLVPVIGYLLATLIFMPLLAFRVGYRDWRLLFSVAVLGLLIVVVFKSWLAVKIPGGAVYEYLPDGLRSFMLVNF